MGGHDNQDISTNKVILIFFVLIFSKLGFLVLIFSMAAGQSPGNRFSAGTPSGLYPIFPPVQ